MLLIIIFGTIAGILVGYFITVLICRYFAQRKGSKLSRSRIEPVSSGRQNSSRTPRVIQNIPSGSLESRDRDHQTVATANRTAPALGETESPLVKRKQVTGTPDNQIPMAIPYAAMLEDYFSPDLETEPIINILTDPMPLPRVITIPKVADQPETSRSPKKKLLKKDLIQKQTEDGVAQGPGVRSTLVVKSNAGVNSQTNLSHHLLDKKSVRSRTPRRSGDKRPEPEGSLDVVLGNSNDMSSSYLVERKNSPKGSEKPSQQYPLEE